MSDDILWPESAMRVAYLICAYVTRVWDIFVGHFHSTGYTL